MPSLLVIHEIPPVADRWNPETSPPTSILLNGSLGSATTTLMKPPPHIPDDVVVMALVARAGHMNERRASSKPPPRVRRPGIRLFIDISLVQRRQRTVGQPPG